MFPRLGRPSHSSFDFGARGAVLVELLICAPILFLLIGGILELGGNLTDRAAILEAMRMVGRETARYKIAGAVPTPDELCHFARTTLNEALVAEGIQADITIVPISFDPTAYVGGFLGMPASFPGVEITVAATAGSLPHFIGDVVMSPTVKLTFPLDQGMSIADSGGSPC